MKDFLKKYSFIQILELVINLCRTKLIFPNARLIRFPIDIRGKKFISIQKGFTTGVGCRLEAYPSDGQSKVLHIGNNVQINDHVHITAMQQVSIGNNVLMASKIYISDCSHGSYSGNESDSNPLVPPNDRPYSIKKVIIEDDVWIGEFVSILPGVTIGKGAIIGTMSVVSKNIPEYTIAVGSPARVIKEFDFEKNRWVKV